MTIRSVAVIGLGAMGAPMARRVQAAGFEVILCDRNATAVTSFAQSRARVAATPAECVSADLVMVLVATPAQVDDVVLGERGVRAGLGGRRPPILAVMSTVPSATVVRLGEVLHPLGIRVIDAPVSGGMKGAEQGTLTIMTGGARQDVEAVVEVFACFAKHQVYCGALGAGEALKILNNMLGLANVVLAAEAYRLALEQGLDLTNVARAIDVSSGRNAFSADPAGPQDKYSTMVRSRESFDSLLSIMHKDFALAVEMASRSGGEYPALRGFETVVTALGNETFDNWRRVAEAPRSCA